MSLFLQRLLDPSCAAFLGPDMPIPGLDTRPDVRLKAGLLTCLVPGRHSSLLNQLN